MKTDKKKMFQVFLLCCLLLFSVAGCGENNGMKDALGNIAQSGQIQQDKEKEEAAKGTEADSRESSAINSEKNSAAEEVPEVSLPVKIPDPGEVIMSGRWGEEITYTLDNNGLLTISGKGKMKRIEGEEYPEQDQIIYLVVEDGITEISSFSDRKELVAVVLGEGVSNLQNDVFAGCNKLSSVTLPSTLSRIGMRAFSNTAITEITLPEKMWYIDNAFVGSALKSIKWPKGVDTIYGATFFMCPNLASVSLPRDVVSIRDGAFRECGELKDIYYEGTEEEFQKIEIGEQNDDFLNAVVHYNEY